MKETNKTKASILNFLNQKLAKGALLLNGQWGTGKTYFIKNVLIPELITEKKINVIYLSLFGISSGVELKNSILAKSIIDAETKVDSKGKVKDRIAKILAKKNFLSNFISSFEVSDLIEFEEVVFIFDDLERVHNENLLLEFMGVITTSLIEENDYKVILIGNLSKIESKGFFVYQEKVISRIISFIPDIEESFNGILMKMKENAPYAHNLISSRIEFIHEILNRYNINNFRSIIQSIDTIIAIINKFDEKNKIILLDEIIYFSLIINNEFRNRNVNQKFWTDLKMNLSGDWPYENLGFQFVDWHEDLLCEISIAAMEKRIRAYSLHEFYLFKNQSDGSPIFFRNLYNLIIFGVLDDEPLINEISYLTDMKIERLTNKKYEIALEFYNWENTKAEIFLKVKEGALLLLSDKNTPLTSFISIFKTINDAKKITKGIFDDITLPNFVNQYKEQGYIISLKSKNQEYLESLKNSIKYIPEELKNLILSDIEIAQKGNIEQMSKNLIEKIDHMYSLKHSEVADFLSYCDPRMAANKLWRFIFAEDYNFTDFRGTLEYIVKKISLQNIYILNHENVESIISYLKIDFEKKDLSALDKYRYNSILAQMQKMVTIYNAFELIALNEEIGLKQHTTNASLPTAR